MARLDDQGNLDYSYDQFDPNAVVKPNKQTVTDPSVQDAPPPDPSQWTPGSSAPPPGSAPPGMHWDANMANWVADAPPAGGGTGGATKPSGGNINDPAYLDSLIAYYGSQPGVNPSVKNDPNYWKQAVASGRFNGDENYLIQRFFQAEGPPEGGGTGSQTQAQPGAQFPVGPSNTPMGIPSDSSPLSGFLQQWLTNQSTNQANVNGQRQGVLDRLNKMADQYGQPVSADDPIIKGQTDAYHGTMGRAVNLFQKKAAERAYAEGVPTGAFDSQVGNATMTAGQNEGTLQSQLMTDELNSRRANLMQTLQSEGSVLNAQDQSDLQNKIAAIDASLKNSGLSLQDKLGTGNLNLGARGQDITQGLGLGSLDLQRILGKGALDNQGKSIDNQNNQFYDKFGADQANNSSALDDALVSLILSGGLK